MVNKSKKPNNKIDKLRWTTAEYKALLPCHKVNCLVEAVEMVNAVSEHVRSPASVQHAASRKCINLVKKPHRIAILEKEAEALLSSMAHWKSSGDGSYETALNSSGYYKKLDLIEKLKKVKKDYHLGK